MYICGSVLTILDVLKYVTQLWLIPTFALCLHDVGHAQFCVVMYNIHVITVVIVAVFVTSLYFRSDRRV